MPSDVYPTKVHRATCERAHMHVDESVSKVQGQSMYHGEGECDAGAQELQLVSVTIS